MIVRFLYAILPAVALLFVTAGRAAAQLYFHSPNDTLTAETTVNSQVTLNITQVHPGMDTLYFTWAKVTGDLPVGWQATICDNNTCYPDLMESGQTLPVLPGDDGLMLIHCTTSSQTGTAIIRYAISEASTPQQVDTLTWIISVPAVAQLEDFPENKLSFTIDDAHFVNITGNSNKLKELNVVDLSGEIVFSMHLLTEKKVQLPLQLHGVFFITLSEESAITRKKITL